MNHADQIKANIQKFSQYKHFGMSERFFDLSLDAMLKYEEELNTAKAALIEAMKGLDFDGLVAEVGYGVVSLTPSSKVEGLWQVTTFNENNIPLGDLGCVEKAVAIDQFLEEVGYRIDESEIIPQLKI